MKTILILDDGRIVRDSFADYQLRAQPEAAGLTPVVDDPLMAGQPSDRKAWVRVCFDIRDLYHYLSGGDR